MADVAERLILGKLNSRILKTLKKLNREQVMLKNKLRMAYKHLSHFLKESSPDVENPELDYEGIIDSSDEPQNLSPDQIMETNLKTIRNDIFANLQLIPPKRQYTMLKKFYSYCLFIKSESAYDFTRLVVPLPCETNLRETIGNQIELIEEQLTNIDRVGEIFQLQNECFPEEPIDVVLSVDAFRMKIDYKMKVLQF
ncbi:hypothetical protein M9Y10_037430 [Tritrichomonas musculus]|uniref:Uncharacterized protein n=1 Tax=Tritrichomonas musculus TaxID=1915356 RepID=A0ABR2GSK5_9EUKA